MTFPSSITSLFGDVVTKAASLPYGASNTLIDYLKTVDSRIVQLNYQFGILDELHATLAQMKKGQTTPPKMFPLIWLIEDITIDRTAANGYGDVSLRVVIAYPTKASYKSAQRETEVFAPILRPVYQNLLEAISLSGPFDMPSKDFGIPHRVTERKRWGSDTQAQDKLTTFVDAIDIENLDLKINFSNCYTPLTT